MEEETLQVSSFNSLFSCFITLYSLILIYFPNDLLRIFLSPVLLISGALLLSLLRLGSTRESNTRPEKSYKILKEAEEPNVFLVRDSDLMGDFVEWNLRAPLEVIHEAYEEEEEEEDPNEKDPTRFRKIERYPSLSLCYPESDSESDSASSSEFNFPEIGDWNSPEDIGFRWEEEDDDGGIGGEGLIEIKLDEYNHRSHNSKMMNKWKQTEIDFHGEDDGLIEIDLFP
uniref:At4g21500p-like protein n=1 Tax=Arabidopsis lyrata TaxID=59689 RepID=A0A068CQK6_ARALY|nr:At4g21500p-like protein [Arabidopsis lyrata]